MLAKSFNVTPYAAMARPVAGTRKGSIIIAVPGSPKAAKENVEAVVKLLPHACDLVCGGDSRAMHAERKVANSGAGVMDDKERSHAAYEPKHDHSRGHHHHHGHGPGHGGHGVKPRTSAEERVLLSNQLGAKGINLSLIRLMQSHNDTGRLHIQCCLLLKQLRKSSRTHKYFQLPHSQSTQI